MFFNDSHIETLIYVIIVMSVLSITAFGIYDEHKNTQYCIDNGYDGYDSTKQLCYKYIQKQNDIGYEIKYSGIIRGNEDE